MMIETMVRFLALQGRFLLTTEVMTVPKVRKNREVKKKVDTKSLVLE